MWRRCRAVRSLVGCVGRWGCCCWLWWRWVRGVSRRGSGLAAWRAVRVGVRSGADAPTDRTYAGVPGALAGPPVTVRNLDHSLLGVSSGWELFGRSDGEVIRVQPARGRITRTRVPALASTGPVTFVVTATSAMIRPIDSVPGLLVPDGHPARQMPTDVSTGGPLFPGPRTPPRCGSS
jgi:hypothetical protein